MLDGLLFPKFVTVQINVKLKIRFLIVWLSTYKLLYYTFTSSNPKKVSIHHVFPCYRYRQCYSYGQCYLYGEFSAHSTASSVETIKDNFKRKTDLESTHPVDDLSIFVYSNRIKTKKVKI